MHRNIPEDARWLAGEGAGSWFVVTARNNDFLITRYSPDGKVECSGTYNADIPVIPENGSFEIGYQSNCSCVTLINGENRIVVKRG
ncbi:MAG: hypothetical protein LC649_08170 [Bacteroidales bacterium]|nr:hypothetical protein [Bacteroidales bacterium]